jgi:hypothetical protein
MAAGKSQAHDDGMENNKETTTIKSNHRALMKAADRLVDSAMVEVATSKTAVANSREAIRQSRQTLKDMKKALQTRRVEERVP